jgi:GNAT superfamily N-acetyltransferase
LPEETITCLEMISPTQLIPGRTPPEPIDIEEAGPAVAPLIRSTYVRIGASLGWTGRSAWSDEQWEEELSQPGVRAWIACVDEETLGLIELERDADCNVGIVVFGVVPEFIGKGFGGALLALATQLAWRVTLPDRELTRRVWVQTSSRDHPHALRNYMCRGFTVFRADTR